MRKLLKQTLALATSVAMCLSVASPVLTAYADDTTAPTADSYVDAGDTADVNPFDSIAAPDTSDTEAANTEAADTEAADTEAADDEAADTESADTEAADDEAADAETTDISKATKPTTFEENRQAAQQGGEVAGIARKALESRTGKPVITEKNAADLQQLVTDIVIDAAELPESK